ncbi:lipoprotein NlpI [Parashewanella curva]|uniref:Lipoprotein NlpI n=1 Tax=Parashewanella curva TaxID=2338552 RepID=A0A3L8Q2R3_9GAMM|nr:lipoprotein NlpI [Parashewanella curva]RLV61298.1 lipoprotein NlpI [Parashewanella curva]
MTVNWRILKVALVVSLLSGCASTTLKNHYPTRLLVEPTTPLYQDELNLLKSSDILSRAKLTDEQRARFMYERGVIYDRVGLQLSARYDFRQALNLNPRLADAYNFLGIYSTLEGDFDSAYDAFDSVLELAPSYEYAYLNRGIALYYAGRFELSKDDLTTFYTKAPDDAYRSIWLYLAHRKFNPEKAKIELTQRVSKLDKELWSTQIAEYLLGNLSADKLVSKANEYLDSKNHRREYTEHLCEAYFYIAQQALHQGHLEAATQLFRLALATDVYDFVEYRLAGFELSKLEGEFE